MNINNLDVASILLGAIATGCVGAIVKVISYLYSQKDSADDQAFKKILGRLDRMDEKNSDFREEWGAFKKELQIISASAMVVKQAAEEIIIVRRNLETAFKRVDELRDASAELSLNIRQGYKVIIGRLHILKKCMEALGGKIDDDTWSDPSHTEPMGKS
jgi:succinate dehydrogenase/fumarate reductase flavoprotein subunit